MDRYVKKRAVKLLDELIEMFNNERGWWRIVDDLNEIRNEIYKDVEK